jgi:hypothetical protein
MYRFNRTARKTLNTIYFMLAWLILGIVLDNLYSNDIKFQVFLGKTFILIVLNHSFKLDIFS